MSGFDLIIFDCDGVLVDSERLANSIFASIIEEECGLKLSLEESIQPPGWALLTIHDAWSSKTARLAFWVRSVPG